MKCLRVGSLLLMLTTLAVAQNQFVYTNNQSSPNTVSGFLVHSDGSLTQVPGSPFATGDNGQNGTPFAIAVTTLKENNYLYAANGADGTISGFRINPATGKLHAVPGSPLATNGQSADYSVAVSPDSRFLFVASDAAALIHVFHISRGTGRLREVPGGPFQVDTPFSGLKVSTNGKFLLVSGGNGGVTVFRISNSGAISDVPGSPFPSSAPVGVVENNCAGNLVFAAGFGFIDVYSLGANGSLTPVPGSPFSDGEAHFDMVLSPTNQFLFTSGGFSQTDSVFTVSANGSLSQIAGSPFPLPDFTSGIATTSKRDFLYTALFISGSVDGEKVGADGTLTPVPGTPFETGENSIAGLVESVVAFPGPSCSRH
jgi:6-phosphogluconolactonase (cycloisomerase 2 family)